MRFRILIATFLSLQLIAVSYAVGQEQEKADDKQPEMLTLQVLVVDPDGYPVENATVSPAGLIVDRAILITNGFGNEPISIFKTDEAGQVEFPCPKFSDDKEIDGVILMVEHPDFVGSRQTRSVNQQPIEIVLEFGFRIAATAVDAETGQPIQQDLYGLVSGDSRISEWKLAENGTLVTPVFQSNKTWFRLIKIVPGEPNLYSDLIEVDPGDRMRVMLRDVELTKGTRVVGRVDDSVPRPIVNGRIAAMIFRESLDGDRFNWRSRWSWYDKTAIAEDGTFFFESLPTGEILQLIPLCDGWVPSVPTIEDVLPFYPEETKEMVTSSVRPQLVHLTEPEIEITLKMVPAASIKATVVDPDGKPLVGASVFASPNQRWFVGGAQFLGTSSSSADHLTNARQQQSTGSAIQNYHIATTDDNGVAIINLLPSHRSESISVFMEGYETQREIPVDLKPGEVSEITIQMQPVGSQALSDKTLPGDDDD